MTFSYVTTSGLYLHDLRIGNQIKPDDEVITVYAASQEDLELAIGALTGNTDYLGNPSNSKDSVFSFSKNPVQPMGHFRSYNSTAGDVEPAEITGPLWS